MKKFLLNTAQNISTAGKEFHSFCGGSAEIAFVFICMISLPFLLVGYLIYGSIFGFKEPVMSTPQAIEEVREKRNEKMNEAGKSVHEFLRGAAGLDKSEKKP